MFYRHYHFRVPQSELGYILFLSIFIVFEVGMMFISFAMTKEAIRRIKREIERKKNKNE